MKRIIASFASLVLVLRDRSIKGLFGWIVQFFLKLLGLKDFLMEKFKRNPFRNFGVVQKKSMHCNSVLYKQEFPLNFIIVKGFSIEYLLKFVNRINMNLHIIKWITFSAYLLFYSQWIAYVPYSGICIQEMIDHFISKYELIFYV